MLFKKLLSLGLLISFIFNFELNEPLIASSFEKIVFISIGSFKTQSYLIRSLVLQISSALFDSCFSLFTSSIFFDVVQNLEFLLKEQFVKKKKN